MPVREGDEIGAAGGPAAADFEDAGADGRAPEPGFAVEMGFAGILMKRMRYFSDGTVIGGKECVELCFEKARGRFGPKRKTGARRLRSAAAEAAGVLWTARDLQKGVVDSH